MSHIIVTGSESFIGKNLIKILKKENKQVVGIDKIKKTNNTDIELDICSDQLLNINLKNIDKIIHLAALSRDADCKNNSKKCFETNVLGTLNIIELCEKINAKQLIFASTEWVYDNFSKNTYKTEDDTININNINSEYALSKLVSEHNLRQKCLNGFCNTTVLRFGIVYGPRLNCLSAVESIFHNIKNNNKIEVGSLRTARSFINVTDLCYGIISSFVSNNFEIINLQGNKLISLKEIIDVSSKILNKKISVIETSPNDSSIRLVSNEKAKKILNWEAKISLEKGLNELKEFLEKNDVKQ